MLVIHQIRINLQRQPNLTKPRLLINSMMIDGVITFFLNGFITLAVKVLECDSLQSLNTRQAPHCKNQQLLLLEECLCGGSSVYGQGHSWSHTGTQNSLGLALQLCSLCSQVPDKSHKNLTHGTRHLNNKQTVYLN